MNTKSFTLIFLFFLLAFSINSKAQNDDTQTNSPSIENKQEEFLLPINIYKNITNRITKQKLIKDLNIELVMHRGGMDYFQIGKTTAGLRFAGQSLISVSFRYFGEDGLNYEADMVKAGFILKKRKKTLNLETEPSDIQTLNGEMRIYRKGNIICNVYDGTYIGFTFSKTPN